MSQSTGTWDSSMTAANQLWRIRERSISQTGTRISTPMTAEFATFSDQGFLSLAIFEPTF
jgi:hypothetical protein